MGKWVDGWRSLRFTVKEDTEGTKDNNYTINPAEMIEEMRDGDNWSIGQIKLRLVHFLVA
jgi:hypothetical protein